MAVIDLNGDLGEGGPDAALLPLLTSANVACGLHAGSPALMRRTVALARTHGVALGAHPGFADREGFGRRELPVTPEEAYALTLYQLGALSGFAAVEGWPIAHVKPHGALYNMAARDPAIAGAIARAVHDFDPALVLFGLAGSALVSAGRARGLRVAEEFFADRAYQPDGALVPRGRIEAVLHDPQVVTRRVIQAVLESTVTAIDGTVLAVRADTVCLHGDTPEAVPFAVDLRRALEAAGIRLAPAVAFVP